MVLIGLDDVRCILTWLDQQPILHKDIPPLQEGELLSIIRDHHHVHLKLLLQLHDEVFHWLLPSCEHRIIYVDENAHQVMSMHGFITSNSKFNSSAR